MNRLKKINQIRKDLKNGSISLGSWMQIPHPSIAEIIGQAGYDWVAIDLEHGSISIQQLPDIFRSLELGDTLPLVRLAEGSSKDCKQALDAGAGGVIVPMIESAEQLENVKNSCNWPPTGNRGVGFSRANLFGKYFENYSKEAQSPLFVGMIENLTAVNNLEEILEVEGLDAILIGPYDLSASMRLTAKFDHPEFINVLNKILTLSSSVNIPCGIHVVDPSLDELKLRIKEGYNFIVYSIDAVFFNSSVVRPTL
jgi:2-dehydro-3-deoxyglucarate aldolase